MTSFCFFTLFCLVWNKIAFQIYDSRISFSFSIAARYSRAEHGAANKKFDIWSYNLADYFFSWFNILYKQNLRLISIESQYGIQIWNLFEFASTAATATAIAVLRFFFAFTVAVWIWDPFDSPIVFLYFPIQECVHLHLNQTNKWK